VDSIANELVIDEIWIKNLGGETLFTEGARAEYR